MLLSISALFCESITNVPCCQAYILNYVYPLLCLCLRSHICIVFTTSGTVTVAFSILRIVLFGCWTRLVLYIVVCTTCWILRPLRAAGKAVLVEGLFVSTFFYFSRSCLYFNFPYFFPLNSVVRSVSNVLPSVNFQILEMYRAFPAFHVFFGNKSRNFGQKLLDKNGPYLHGTTFSCRSTLSLYISHYSTTPVSYTHLTLPTKA